MNENNKQSFFVPLMSDGKPAPAVIAPAVLPDGNGGFTPCPELLTEAEAIRYLRLDVSGPQNPVGTLKYYRDRGILRGVQIGRNLRYPRKELDSMVDRLIEKRDDSR